MRAEQQEASGGFNPLSRRLPHARAARNLEDGDGAGCGERSASNADGDDQRRDQWRDEGGHAGRAACCCAARARASRPARRAAMPFSKGFDHEGQLSDSARERRATESFES